MLRQAHPAHWPNAPQHALSTAARAMAAGTSCIWVYSAFKASTGLSAEARMAGYSPKTIPIPTVNKKEMPMIPL